MKQSTICFLLKNTSEREVLLGFKKTGFGAGKFTGIGGKVEPGETVEGTAMREVEEEIGVKILANEIQFKGTVTFLFPSKMEWSQQVSIFTAESWVGDPRESNEMRPSWFKLKEIPYVSMWQDAPYWIPQIVNGSAIQAKFTFKHDKETLEEAVVALL
jgi:8-oxo-dGTP diphosphatase